MKSLDFFVTCLRCVWFMSAAPVSCPRGLRLEGGVDWVARHPASEEANKVVNIMKEIMANLSGQVPQRNFVAFLVFLV